MGGYGGGGRGLQRKQLDELEQAARESLREGAQPQKRNVFISFAHEDLGEVNLLRAQAKNENSNLEFNDWSLREPFDSESAEYVRRGIRERIRQSSVTICYITENTAESKWCDWEIRETIKMNKGVVAVHKGDSPPSHLPPALMEFGIKPIKWNQMEINNAIEKAAKA
ncbi:MAG: TIR domain-containing protein [Dehalococcoides mccartyi]|uniref:TIR domain-containing protein n=1 Tax=Dehalococcoides mccartyi TaxID=61435 RepID=UPI0030F4C0FE